MGCDQWDRDRLALYAADRKIRNAYAPATGEGEAYKLAEKCVTRIYLGYRKMPHGYCLRWPTKGRGYKDARHKLSGRSITLTFPSERQLKFELEKCRPAVVDRLASEAGKNGKPPPERKEMSDEITEDQLNKKLPEFFSEQWRWPITSTRMAVCRLDFQQKLLLSVNRDSISMKQKIQELTSQRQYSSNKEFSARDIFNVLDEASYTLEESS